MNSSFATNFLGKFTQDDRVLEIWGDFSTALEGALGMGKGFIHPLIQIFWGNSLKMTMGC